MRIAVSRALLACIGSVLGLEKEVEGVGMVVQAVGCVVFLME